MITLDLSVALYPQDNMILIDGSQREMAALADWVASPDVECRAGRTVDGVAISSVGIRKVIRDQQPLVMGIDGADVTITCSQQSRYDLASQIAGFATWNIGDHIHIEWYPKHTFIGEESVPLILTLTQS